MKKYKHGLTCMRCQPLHIGHERIIDQMLEECDYMTVVLGSVQEKGTQSNPFTYEERRDMLYQTFKGKKIFVTGLPDINDPPNWAKFVLDHVERLDGTSVDAYYAGSQQDLSCWSGRVSDSIKLVEIPRSNQEFPYVSGTMVRNMMENQDVRWQLYVPKAVRPIADRLFRTYYWNQKGHLSEAKSKVSGR